MFVGCCVSGEDDGVWCMVVNYVVFGLVWCYLCEFVGMDLGEGEFLCDLFVEMNGYVVEMSVDCELWVWIMEMVLLEIDGGNYKYLYMFDIVDGEFCLLLCIGYVMDYFVYMSVLCDKWNGLFVKFDCVFKV